MSIAVSKNPVQLDRFVIPILLSILLISVATKIRFIFQESLWPDEALYLFISRNLSHDFSALRGISGNLFYKSPPLLMYLLSLAAKTQLLDFDQAARAIVLLMGGGALASVYYVGKKLYNPIVGIMAALFLSVCPLYNWNSLRILTDVPVVFFIYLAITFLVHGRKTAFYIFAICAVLTKYSAFPILCLPLFIKMKPRVWASLYLIIFLILSLFVIINGHYAINLGWLNYFFKFFKAPNFFQMKIETEFFLGYFLLGAAIAGMFFTIKEQKFSALFHWVCLFAICRIFLPWVAFRVSRYTLPLYPGVYIFAAIGCYQSVDLIKARWPQYQKWVVIVLVIVVANVIYLHSKKSLNLLDDTSKSFVGFKDAAVFLMDQPGSKVLATASPRQMKYFAPQFDVYDIHKNMTPEQLRSFFINKQITYLSIDFWSPHLPLWCRSFNFQKNGYELLYGKKNVIVFKVVKARK